MKIRAKTTTWLVLSWLVLLSVISLALAWYVLPHPEWIEVGRLADYPPATEPYPITSMNKFAYLVNDGQQIIALGPMVNQPSHFTAIWRPLEGSFIDPLRGSWYNLYGIPKWHGINGLENQSLPRHPVKNVNEVIYVDLTHSEVIKLNE